MREPGHLEFLGDGAAWDAQLEQIHQDACRDRIPQRLRREPDHDTPYSVSTDWAGLPVRVVRCVGRARALELLDFRDDHGDQGRRRLQEEYVEWRVIRDHDGCITRFEATTEFPEYWAALAAHNPRALLDTVAEFAQLADIDPAAIFGTCDPFDEGTTPAQRAAAFSTTMLHAEVLSSYNNGIEAICCMVHPSNTLASLMQLCSASLQTCTVDVDGVPQPCLAADDFLRWISKFAVGGRASDPILAERCTRLGWDGRIVASEDPAGVYLTGVEHARLRMPDSSTVPKDWFHFSRGLTSHEAPNARPTCQRVVFEVPASTGVRVGDLIDVATEQEIAFGGQLAELLQVTMYLRVGDLGALPAVEESMDLRSLPSEADPCDFVREFTQDHPAA